jgi:hypothetical protein
MANGMKTAANTDRFVQAAPLIVAAVCSDGVAVLAAHTSDDDEPLLYFSPSSKETHVPPKLCEPTIPYWLDLPKDFDGPYRVQPIDENGNTLLATGWRADCDVLVERARALAALETRSHGGGSSNSNTAKMLLARQISLFMAQSDASDTVCLPF